MFWSLGGVALEGLSVVTGCCGMFTPITPKRSRHTSGRTSHHCCNIHNRTTPYCTKQIIWTLILKKTSILAIRKRIELIHISMKNKKIFTHDRFCVVFDRFCTPVPWWCSTCEPRRSSRPFGSVARGRQILRAFSVVAWGNMSCGVIIWSLDGVALESLSVVSWSSGSWSLIVRRHGSVVLWYPPYPGDIGTLLVTSIMVLVY
jgi:hypothetical protein